MKSTKFILLIYAIVLISCNKEQALKIEKPANDTITVYSEFEYYKLKSKKIKIIDTACMFDERRAKNDIREGKLIYTMILGFGAYDYSNKEMGKLLLKKSILLDSVLKPCMRPPEGFKWYCYAKLMNLEIEKRFGKNFIDSLRNIADKQFIENKPNYIFDFYECDTSSRYASAETYEEFLEKPKNDFLNKLNYPKMTKSEMRKQRANTEVSFVIYKNGSVGNIKLNTDYDIAKNKEYAKYFEGAALEFVKNAKWKPATYRGFNVNSEMHLNLFNQ